MIELYDDRPIENVLGSEVFCPERTVFLCPPEAAQDKGLQQKLREYFSHQGLETELVFLESSLYNTAKLLRQLESVVETYPDCVMDITGGTDAALFACGQICAEKDVPAFTYSRRRNRFFNIQGAPFADDLLCEVQHSVEDCFMMAGGALRQGRVDNAVLEEYMDFIDPFFNVYLRHRTEWTTVVNYIQRASQTEKGKRIPLYVNSTTVVKGDRGRKINVPEKALRELQGIGFLKKLSIRDGRVSFRFRDQQVRTWLRDIGSVLELYIYKACLDTGAFNDVVTSAIVDWEGTHDHDSVTNEIDVMAMQGIIPAFISCKTCDVSTEALNELAVLRDRFGGETAKAAIVTAQRCRSITRHRAAELGIEVIDLDDLKAGKTVNSLKDLMRQK